jgi:hypothetical protein
VPIVYEAGLTPQPVMPLWRREKNIFPILGIKLRLLGRPSHSILSIRCEMDLESRIFMFYSMLVKCATARSAV